MYYVKAVTAHSAFEDAATSLRWPCPASRARPRRDGCRRCRHGPPCWHRNGSIRCGRDLLEIIGVVDTAAMPFAPDRRLGGLADRRRRDHQHFGRCSTRAKCPFTIWISVSMPRAELKAVIRNWSLKSLVPSMRISRSIGAWISMIGISVREPFLWMPSIGSSNTVVRPAQALLDHPAPAPERRAMTWAQRRSGVMRSGVCAMLAKGGQPQVLESPKQTIVVIESHPIESRPCVSTASVHIGDNTS